jgi:acetyl-CoA carboxylase biotin carboxyl carrier protein
MDIKQIKNLVSLMVENELSELEISEGETHIVLRRSLASATGNPQPVAAVLPAPADQANRRAQPAPAAEEQPSEPQALQIRSPMVGTFYASPDPESPPFVRVGDVVEPNTVVCLVEAMKVFNEIKAEVSGRLTAALVKNAEAVEYDQPLFTVAPL